MALRLRLGLGVAVDLHGLRGERGGEGECAERRGEQAEIEDEIGEIEREIGEIGEVEREIGEIGREMSAPDVHAWSGLGSGSG